MYKLGKEKMEEKILWFVEEGVREKEENLVGFCNKAGHDTGGIGSRAASGEVWSAFSLLIAFSVLKFYIRG